MSTLVAMINPNFNLEGQGHMFFPIVDYETY